MRWKKEFGPEHDQFYQIFSVIILLSMIPALLMRLPLLQIIFSLLLAFIWASRYYDQKIGLDINLENPKRTIRLFPGQQTDLKLTVQNESFLPVINGKISFQMGSVVSSDIEKQTRYNHEIIYYVPLSIMRKGKAQINIPVQAKARGTTRLTYIRYDFPHPINTQSIGLTYQPFYRTEIIVYPEPLPVSGLKERLYLTPGEKKTAFSPFEDVLSPAGTRDYIQSDPFHRIHWKASAKRQDLQTKVYERTWNHTWTIVVNISKKSRLGNAFVTPDLEKLMSYAAFICHTLTKKDQSFELLINAQKLGEPPYFHYLHEGQGRSHLRKSLELLARIHSSSMVIPFSRLLYKLDQPFNQPKTIVVLGDVDHEDMPVLAKWKRRGLGVLVLQETENGATLAESWKEGDLYAQR